MPVCLKSTYLGTLGTGQLGNGRVVLSNEAAALTSIRPLVPVLDSTVQPVENCELVALTSAEFLKFSSVSDVTPNAWQELGNMSIENANVISAYVALVWAVAWGFRAIRSAISTYESKENE